MMNSRVFILERPRRALDISPAEVFGEIWELFNTQRYEKRPSMFNTHEYGEEIIRRLTEAGYDPRRDCFCVVGSMVAMVVAIATLVSRYKTVRVLLYNSVSNEYIERLIGESDGADNTQNTVMDVA